MENKEGKERKIKICTEVDIDGGGWVTDELQKGSGELCRREVKGQDFWAYSICTY